MRLLDLWACGQRACVVPKSTGRRRLASEIERADAMGAKMHAEHGILVGRAQRDRLAAKRSADVQDATFERDVAAAIDLAHDVVGSVFDRRKRVGKRTRARAVALGWPGKRERLMRPLVIIDMPPAVERALTVGEIAEGSAIEDLRLERAVEAFVLALGQRFSPGQW